MELVQFEIPGRGRRVGVVLGDDVHDLTASHAELKRTYDLFLASAAEGRRLTDFVGARLRNADGARLRYADLWDAAPGGGEPFLRPPLDHADPRRVLVSGTGLTHTGGMQSRHRMHTNAPEAGGPPRPEAEATTDSARMFELGLRGGKPGPGERGVAPEWFYKGDGGILRGHREPLEIPAFAADGGEEPELVGCYVIDARGTPRRLGFAVGNEWSDHATEKLNYLYLAPSKLRTCAVGPSLGVTWDFTEVRLRCTVRRGEQTLYDSGVLLSGERWMCHSLRNLEDHHFKYSQHRRPGDVHLHFFGTSRLSHGERAWRYEPGDEIQIEAEGFGPPLVNRVTAGPQAESRPVAVEPA